MPPFSLPFSLTPSLSPAELPAEGGGDVLRGGPEQRGGDVQQRGGGTRPGGVPAADWRAGAPQGLLEVPGAAGQQE